MSGEKKKKKELKRYKEKLKSKGEKLTPEKAEEAATESAVDRLKLEEMFRQSERLISEKNAEKLSKQERLIEMEKKLAEQGVEREKLGMNKYTRVKLAEGRLKELLKKKGTVETEELMGIEAGMERMTPRRGSSLKAKKGAKETTKEGFKETMEAISNLKVSKKKKEELYKKLEGASEEMKSLAEGISKYGLQESIESSGEERKVNQRYLDSHKRGVKEALEEADEMVEEKIEKMNKEPLEIGNKEVKKAKKTEKASDWKKKKNAFDRDLERKLNEIKREIENVEKDVAGEEDVNTKKKNLKNHLEKNSDKLEADQVKEIANILRPEEKDIYLAELASDLEEKLSKEQKKAFKEEGGSYVESVLS